MAIKVAFIGAGSIGFTRRLMRDILAVPELADTHFALHDIDAEGLRRVQALCEKDIQANRLPAKITASLDRRKALEGADYVINCSRIGGLEAFKLDIEIPLQYGIDQCVGDTICAGGIMYGQRSIPQILAFCQDIREVAQPDALFLNYANPMAMNTWAALDYGWPRTVGLCHGVEGGWWQIAQVLAHYHNDKDIPWEQHRWKEYVQVICAGINHQTWYLQVIYRGRPVSSEELLAAFEAHPRFRQTEKVRIDVLRRFGYYCTESNGHLSEYLPWYRKRPREIRRWIDLSSWINGETGGYLRVCLEGRAFFESDYQRWLAEAGKPIGPQDRSGEHASWIIEALETGRAYRGHFNVRNSGVITNLPEDCVVEAPGYVDRTGFHMMAGIRLPLACAATCLASINVQRMAKEAAVHADVKLLKQAMLHDPLVGAVCNPEEVWQMTDHLLIAQAKWLPQYQAAGEIAKARRRLAEHVRNGTRVRLKKWKGAARRPVRSVAELRRERELSVLAADKAAAQRAKDAAQAAARKKK